MKTRLALTFCGLLSSGAMAAAGFPVQARLFASLTQVDPKELNGVMTSQGLKEFKYYSALGVEMTYPVIPMLDIGLRYAHRSVTMDEDPSSSATSYAGTMTQDQIQLVARVPLIRTSLLKLDVFGAAGGANSTFEINSAGLNGKLTRTASSANWYASPTFSYGVSAGAGYKKFYLFAEGGFEQNKVTKLKATGSPGSISEINLTGPYVMIGLLFDGVTAHQK